jgi:hypothetical protein
VAQKCKNEHIIQTELTKGASRANTNNRTTVKKKHFKLCLPFCLEHNNSKQNMMSAGYSKAPKV